MPSPILFGGPTEKLRKILDDDWIIGCLGHDLSYILVDEIWTAEDDLNNNTKYRKDFLETENQERVQSFGSICTIPAGRNESIEIGVIRYDEKYWGLDAFIVIPEEDLVDETLEFNPNESEWEDFFHDATTLGFLSDETRQQVLDLVKELSEVPAAKKIFVEQFNRTLPRYPVETHLFPTSGNGGYRLGVKFIKTSDNRWSIRPHMLIPTKALENEDLESLSDE